MTLNQDQQTSVERRWFRGYVASPILEVAVTAVFGALAGISRLFQIPLFPPLIILDLAGAFVYVPASLVSFPYVLVFILVNTITAPNPLLAVPAWIVSIPLVNLVSKLVRKYVIWVPLIGPYIGISTYVVVLWIAGALPPTISVPTLFVRATVNMVTILILSPIIWKTLERMGVIRKAA